MMKQWELRRALLVVMMLCVFLFIYLYWQQSAKSTSTLPTLVLTYKKVYNSFKRSKSTPQWTWECVNRRCERRENNNNNNYYKKGATSFTTCAMTCGSTQLWPQPTGPVTLGSKTVKFHHEDIEIKYEVKGKVKTLMDSAVDRFRQNVRNLVKTDGDYKSDVRKFLVRLVVTKQDVVKLKMDIDEGYNIDLKCLDQKVYVNITGTTYYGVRHGLETLSQLLWWDDYEESLKVLKVATVKDAPSFPYRGLMIDTSRNFMSIDSLKKVLDGMAANKLNVFHWHVSDSQSFPLVLPSIPQLAKNGAYSQDMVYEVKEVKELVEYARIRGIRVVLEVDTPAHAGNGWTWGPKEGLGELAVCVNERPWSLYCGEPPCGQLNPDNPNVFDLLEKLYKDLIDLSDEREIFHIGGDEVNLECWAQHLQKSNTQYSNYSDLHDLWGEFTTKAMQRLIFANNGVKIPYVIIWSSNLSKRPYLGKYLDKSNVVVQSWGASQWPDTPDLITDGYKVVISHVDAWYLDCGFGRWRETGEAACDPYRPWQTVYNHRPWQQFNLDKRKIIGGEACLWSEQFDETSLDTRLWPRAGAFAERMWTDPQLDVTAYNIQEDVYTRLSTHRERLVARGIKAEAMWPRWCVQNPGMCL